MSRTTQRDTPSCHRQSHIIQSLAVMQQGAPACCVGAGGFGGHIGPAARDGGTATGCGMGWVELHGGHGISDIWRT